MKLKFYLPSLLLSCLLIGGRVSAQCPASVYLSEGNTCLSMQWSVLDLPSKLPPTVEFDGATYTYANGIGATGFPAIYTKPPELCTVQINVLSGTLKLNFASGTVTCQYGVILASRDIAFAASQNQGKNILNWKLKEDGSSKTYELQRSIDGTNFTTIKSLDAKPGNAEASYSYNDNNATASVYYRIKVNEKSGSYWFSKILNVKNDAAKNNLNIFPNPNRGSFMLTGLGSVEIKSLTMFDVQGRKILFTATNINDVNKTATITIKNFATGVLFLQYLSGTNRKYQRFLIQ